MADPKQNRPRIVFFGHFGGGNFGNEATFQAMLWNVRRLIPVAELLCVTTFPANVMQDYGIAAIPISGVVVKQWNLRNPAAKWARKLFVGIPSEIYRWLKAFKTVCRADVFIVVGTGLLNDAFGLASWRPYNVFKWSLVAKLCRCKTLIVSVGVGPLDRIIARFFVKAALSIADFRSYRDNATRQYLQGIGFRANADRVYPDLAFSLPPEDLSKSPARIGRRPAVGLGLMALGGMYGVDKPTDEQHSGYLQVLVDFAKWLITRGYDVRLLIGEAGDGPIVERFKSQMYRQQVPGDHVIAEPVTSTANLLSQIAATDFIVATRFHNILLGLFLNKPSISISFHQKCFSLMNQMELSEYWQPIQALRLEKLIEQFRSLENNAESIRIALAGKVAAYRVALDEQYQLIRNEIYGCRGRHSSSSAWPIKNAG